MPHQTLRRLPKLCVSAPHGGLGHRQYDTRHAVVDATCPTSVNVVVLRGDLRVIEGCALLTFFDGFHANREREGRIFVFLAENGQEEGHATVIKTRFIRRLG